MSNKKKEKGGSGGGSGWQKDEDEIQAIILTDSFTRKFAPITDELPRALLPLGNRPMLDFTIEYVIEQGIEEIIVFCCCHGEKIRDYVSKKWVNYSKKCNIQCFMSSTADCISEGDAIREIDREGLIRSDFILVPGDLISNIKLPAIIKKHKAKRKKEKNLVMTKLYREADPGHYTRCREDNVVIGLEDETNRLLFWQKPRNISKMLFSTGVLADRKQINIRYDFSNCHISICSPQVAPLFTDNFDYQTVDDFIRGILINEEILGDKIDAHVVQNGYSTRVSDLHMYNAVSLDYLNRWVDPLIPSTPVCKRNNVYIEKNVHLGRNTSIDNCVLIGENTSIGDNVSLSKCVIGSNCNIGNNVSIHCSYVWDNVSIDEDSSIVQTMICSGAKLKQSVKLIDSIVSFNVIISDGMNLPPFTKLSCIKKDDDFIEQVENIDLEEKCPEYDVSFVGVEGKGYSRPDIDEDDENIIPSLTGNRYDSSTEEESSDEEMDDSAPPTPPNESNNLFQFHAEVVENLRYGIVEKTAPENIALEINASKFKFNISIQELCQTVMKAVLELSFQDGSKSKPEMIKELDNVTNSLHDLLLKYYNSPETQMQAILSSEEFIARNYSLSNVFATLLHKLYEKDILEESAILLWYKNPPVADDFSLQTNYEELRENQNLSKFVTWLQEAEEDSDSEEESE